MAAPARHASLQAFATRASPSLVAASSTLSSLALALFAACSGSSAVDDGALDGGATGSSGTGASGSSGASSGQPDPAGDGAPVGMAPEIIAAASCSAAVPDGAELAAPLPTYAGTCPALATAGAFTTIASFVSLSGGVGGVVRGWTPTAHATPAVVLWGGSGDVFPPHRAAATKPLPSPGFPAWCARGQGKAVARPSSAACP